MSYELNRPFDKLRANIRFWLVVLGINLVNIPSGALLFMIVWWFREWCYWQLGVRFLGYYLDMAGIRVKTKGIETLRPDLPRVYISNHLSHLDISAAMRHLPIRFHFIAKKELLRIPIFGWALPPLGMYMIDRSTTEKAYESIRAAAKNIVEKNESVMIYPEGGISRTGQLQPFKKGAFTLAIEAGVPIVPVIVRNSGNLFSVIRRESRPGAMSIEVLEPIDTSAYTQETKEQLRDKVFDVMKKAQETEPEF